MELIEVADEPFRRPRAQDLFVDRNDQSVTLHLVLLNHEARVHTGEAGYSEPRRNVLAFHGASGVGKTQLSNALRAWLDGTATPTEWGDPPALDRPIRTIRVDLEGALGFDAERLMFRIRAELGDTSVRLDAFDLGLATYWEVAHPGQPFPEIRSSRPRRRAVGDQLHESLTEILQDQVGLEGLGIAGAVVRGLRATYNVTRTRLAEGRAARCPDLVTVVEALLRKEDLTHADAVHLAPLLRWDLDQCAVNGRPQLVIFIDGYERAQADMGTSDAEIRALAYYLPEVFFVITGRNRVRWGQPLGRASRTKTGPEIWPGLVAGTTGEPSQHLLGMLSDEDALAFLELAAKQVGLSRLPADVRNAIVDVASGLPLFLDLAVDSALDLIQKGQSVAREAFESSHGEIVSRAISDLDPGSRALLRTASLLPSWDIALLHESSDAPQGRISGRFLERAFVYRDADTVLPFRVHDTLRRAVLGQTISMGEWNHQDWARAGERALEALRRRIETSSDPYAQKALIRASLEVCSRSGVEADWLRLAAFKFPSLPALASALPPVDPSIAESYGTHLHEILLCHTHPRYLRADALHDLATSGRLEPVLEAQAWRHYAYKKRADGEYDEAVRVLANLAEGFAFSRELHLGEKALTLVMAGQLDRAAADAASLPDDRQDRVLSTVKYWEGRLDQAASGYQRRRQTFMAKGDDRNASLHERNEAFCRGFLDPPATEFAERARRDAEQRSTANEVVSVIAAQIACAAGQARKVDRLLREASDVIGDVSPIASGRQLVALGFHSAAIRDEERLRDIDQRLERLPGVILLYRQIVRFWLEELTGLRSAEALGIRWTEDENTIRRRWVDLVHARRSRLGAAPA